LVIPVDSLFAIAAFAPVSDGLPWIFFIAFGEPALADDGVSARGEVDAKLSNNPAIISDVTNLLIPQVSLKTDDIVASP